MNPFVLCFTGTSGSGKTTLANAVGKHLAEENVRFQIIDGDILRDELNNLFGYTKEERMKQNQVVKVLGRYLRRQGIHLLIAIVAPYDEMRKGMRDFFGEGFFQIYVKCPYEVCEQRDTKGYYHLSKQKQMQHLNGADDVYEVPMDSDLTLDSSKNTVSSCVEEILTCLREHGYAV